MDFFINNYVNFLLNYNISLTAGFFLWHFIVFVLGLFIIFLFVNCFMRTKYSIGNDNSDNNLLNNISNSLPFCLAINIFIFLLLPFSQSFYPIKTDVSLALFLAVLLMPVVFVLFSAVKSFDFQAVKKLFNKSIKVIILAVPFFIAQLSVIILSGTLSFRDIIAMQNSHSVLSWFCFPAFVGFCVSVFSVTLLLKEEFFERIHNSKLVTLIKNSLLFIICVYIVILFLGGYMPVIPVYVPDSFRQSPVLYECILSLEQIFWIMLKTYFLLYLILYLKSTNLFSADKTFGTYVKYLLAAALVNLFIVSFISLTAGDFYVL